MHGSYGYHRSLYRWLCGKYIPIISFFSHRLKGRDAKSYQPTKVIVVLLFLLLYSKEVLPGPWIGSLRKDDRFWHSRFEQKKHWCFFVCVFVSQQNALKWYAHFYFSMHSTFKSQWRNHFFFMSCVGFKINRGVLTQPVSTHQFQQRFQRGKNIAQGKVESGASELKLCRFRGISGRCKLGALLSGWWGGCFQLHGWIL